MTGLAFLLAVLVLPLFPFSMAAVALLERIGDGSVRAAVLLAWPVGGALVLGLAETAPPTWLVAWAMLTALLYAWRALALRDVGQWVIFLAVSGSALIWAGAGTGHLALKALGIGLPLAMMSNLVGLTEKRFGAAHMRLGLGLATSAPRLSALFVIGLFAAIAMPVSPSFFSLLALVAGQATVSFATVLAILLCWLLWTWSAMRILQGIVAGPAHSDMPNDITQRQWAVMALLFLALGVAGVLLGGVIL